MAGSKEDPLTTEEAKARLLAISRTGGIGPWVRRNPFKAMISAAAGGLILGSAPDLRRNVSRTVLAVMPLLARWR